VKALRWLLRLLCVRKAPPPRRSAESIQRILAQPPKPPRVPPMPPSQVMARRAAKQLLDERERRRNASPVSQPQED